MGLLDKLGGNPNFADQKESGSEETEGQGLLSRLGGTGPRAQSRRRRSARLGDTFRRLGGEPPADNDDSYPDYDDTPTPSTALARRKAPLARREEEYPDRDAHEKSFVEEGIELLWAKAWSLPATILLAGLDKRGWLPDADSLTPAEQDVVVQALEQVAKIEQSHDRRSRLRYIRKVLADQNMDFFGLNSLGFRSDDPQFRDGEQEVAVDYFQRSLNTNPDGFTGQDDPKLTDLLSEIKQDLRTRNLSSGVQRSVEYLLELDRYKFLENMRQKLFDDGEIVVFSLPLKAAALNMIFMSSDAWPYLKRTWSEKNEEGNQSLQVVITRRVGGKLSDQPVIVVRGVNELNEIGDQFNVDWEEPDRVAREISNSKLGQWVLGKFTGKPGMRMQSGRIRISNTAAQGQNEVVRIPVTMLVPQERSARGGASFMQGLIDDATALLNLMAQAEEDMDDVIRDDVKSMFKNRLKLSPAEKKELIANVTRQVLANAPRYAAVEYCIREMVNDYITYRDADRQTTPLGQAQQTAEDLYREMTEEDEAFLRQVDDRLRTRGTTPDQVERKLREEERKAEKERKKAERAAKKAAKGKAKPKPQQTEEAADDTQEEVDVEDTPRSLWGRLEAGVDRARRRIEELEQEAIRRGQRGRQGDPNWVEYEPEQIEDKQQRRRIGKSKPEPKQPSAPESRQLPDKQSKKKGGLGDWWKRTFDYNYIPPDDES